MTLILNYLTHHHIKCNMEKSLFFLMEVTQITT